MINMHSIFIEIEDAYIYTKEFGHTRITTLTSRIETLEFKRSIQFNQVLASICIGYDAPNHVVEECPYLISPTKNGFPHRSAFNKKYMNELYAPTWVEKSF